MHSKFYTHTCQFLLMLVLTFWGFGQSTLQAQYAADGAFFAPHNNKVYVFRGEEYIRIDTATMTMDAGYPRTIANGWNITMPNGWEGDWDAVVQRNNGTNVVLIFKANQFLEWDVTMGTIQGPFNSQQALSGLPTSFALKTTAGFANFSSSSTPSFWLFSETEFAQVNANTYAVVQTGNLSTLPGSFYSPNYAHLDAIFALPHNANRYYIRGTQVSHYKEPNDFETNDIDVEFSNWGWTEAVQPIDPGTCDLDVQISDNKCGDLQEIPIAIDNLQFGSNELGVDCQVGVLQVYIEHPFVGDLTLSLVSPSGVEVVLSTRHGGNGDDYGDNCSFPTTFKQGEPNLISAGTPPYLGFYRPEGNFDDFLDGTSAEGNWKLKVCDGGSSDFGILQFADLTFFSFTPVGLEEELEEDQLVLFPNPSNGQVQVRVPQNAQGGTLRVFDLAGKMVYQQAQVPLQAEMDLSQQPAGIYLVHYLDEQSGKSATERLELIK